MGGNRPDGLKLYNFVDNHDVERIYTKLQNKAHFAPVHVLLYTLPGIPSIYYGSEFGIEGKKERWSDDSLRPALNLEDFAGALQENPCTALISALGHARQKLKALACGDYQELLLTNRQYAFSRNLEGQAVLVTVNNDDADARFQLPAGDAAVYTGVLTGERAVASDGQIAVSVDGNSGEIWVPLGAGELEKPRKQQKILVGKAAHPSMGIAADKAPEPKSKPVQAAEGKAAKPKGKPKQEAGSQPMATEGRAVQAAEKEPVTVPVHKSYEEMTVAELQTAVLEKMAENGPVTEEMKRTVDENVWHDSLVNWVKSFR